MGAARQQIRVGEEGDRDAMAWQDRRIPPSVLARLDERSRLADGRNRGEPDKRDQPVDAMALRTPRARPGRSHPPPPRYRPPAILVVKQHRPTATWFTHAVPHRGEADLRPGRLSGFAQHGVESGAVEMPTRAVGIEQEIVL